MLLRGCILFVTLLVKAHLTSCGSLGFVIDRTDSMEKEIGLVRNAVDGIMDIIRDNPNTPIKDVVLVTFSDPCWLTTLHNTPTREELKKSMDSIKVGGGGDCPETSMSGILKALENSLPNSMLFVFTDAPPKDVKETERVKRIARSKQSRIVVVRTTPKVEKCRNEVPEKDFEPYYDITGYTNGVVFKCNNKDEVDDILRYVRLMISGDGTYDRPREIPANKPTEIPFHVDDQIEYVVVTASGINVKLDIISGPTRNYEKITWISNAKVLKISNPKPGDYKALVEGSSTTSVLVFSRTDFTFKHSFSETEPSTFNDDRKQPTDKTRYHLLVNVTDPRNSVDIKSAEILSKNGDILTTLNLQKKSGSYYVTEVFLPPSSTFLIAINGIGKHTKAAMKRIARTPIDPRPKNSDPRIDVMGRLEIDYDGRLQLTCKVNAFPKPRIEWQDESEKMLPGQRTRDLNSYHYESELTIEHMKKSARYYCYAENDLGEATKHVDITVRTPFVVGSGTRTETKNLEYGKQSTLHCDITSKFPMQITWYLNGTEIGNSDNLFIQNRGTELRIVKATEVIEGTYKCKAWLINDKETNVELVRVVTTNGIAPVMGKSEIISVIENNSAMLNCDILNSYPAPTISWQFKKTGANTFENLAENEVNLAIQHADILKSGVYKCIAKNSKGTGDKETALNVLISPRVTLLVNNAEKADINVPFRSTLSVVCRVTSHSAPNIVFKNNRNQIIHSTKTENTKSFEYVSHLTVDRFTKQETFYCEVSNEINRMTKHVLVQPNNPFIDNIHRDTVNFEYGQSGSINCDIKSEFGMQITWYHYTPSGVKDVITNSSKYNVLNDGKELRINKIEESTEGKFSCRAWLTEDKDSTRSHDFNVIINLAAPIMKASDAVAIREKSSVLLKCGITLAYPKPTITWQFKKAGEGTFQTLPNQFGETFNIASADIHNSGEYKCVAQNIKGVGQRVLTLNVMISPRITLLVNGAEASTKNVKYDETVSLTCGVTSLIMPNIVWRNGKSEILKAEKTKTVKMHQYSSLLRIPNFRKDDSFSCEASNNVDKATKYIRVTVDSPIIVSPTTDPTKVIKYGDSSTLNCGLSSLFPLKYTWSLTNTQGKTYVIDNSQHYSLSKDGSDLTIMRMDKELEGQYDCKAVLVDDNTVQKYRTITVTALLELPQIEIVSPILNVRVGENAVMKCKIVKGNPVPKLTWQIKDKLGKLKTLSENGELLIKNTKYEDTGTYSCVANSLAGIINKAVLLTVEGPPVILSDEDKILYGVEGDLSLKVSCVVVGYPRPTVSWMIEGKPVIQGDKFVIKDSHLIINNPVEQDSINYTCKAKNKFGEVSKNFETSITKNIEDETLGDKTYIYLKNGESKEIKCYSGDRPGKWFVQTWPSKITGTYRLSNVTVLIDGNYTCRISTDDKESYSHTYVVDVGYEPKFFRDTDKQYIYWQGDLQKLDCTVDMKPEVRTAKVEWLVNGEASSTKGYLHSVVGWGNYTCTVSNIHGSVTKTFYVTSSNCLIKRDLLKKSTSPLLLDPSSGSLSEFIATNDYFSLKSHSKLLLSCHNKDKQNTFKAIPEKNDVLAVCEQEDKLSIEGKSYKFSELECKKELEPIIVHTDKSCSSNQNTELVRVGYEVDKAKDKFLEVYSICFDKDRKVPLISKMTMTRLTNAETLSGYKWLKVDAFTKGDMEYCDEKSSCCLTRRQLVSGQDVRQGAPQFATLIEGLNSVPVWNNCNRNASWAQVEEQVRSFLLKTKRFECRTGTYGYQDKNGVMVPRFLWKLLRRVVIVWVNDPSPTAEDVRCKTPCAKYNVYNLPEDQFTYCCTLDEFQQHFTSL